MGDAFHTMFGMQSVSNCGTSCIDWQPWINLTLEVVQVKELQSSLISCATQYTNQSHKI
jgi:hypothetical protein